MNSETDVLMDQGNRAFLGCLYERTYEYYLKALVITRGLAPVIRYVKKNQGNLPRDLPSLQELLHRKYHLLFLPAGLLWFLNYIKGDVQAIQRRQSYERFKQALCATHPVTPEQAVDAFLEHNDPQSVQARESLLLFLQELGYRYSAFDLNRLLMERTRVKQLTVYEQSLSWKAVTPLQIDEMDGHEFESFLLRDLLPRLGYRVEQRKKTHEQGLDLRLERFGVRTACQAKRRRRPVGSRAVAEVIAAREYHGCQNALVITNNYFTLPAKKMAKRCKVELWDRDILLKKLTDTQ